MEAYSAWIITSPSPSVNYSAKLYLSLWRKLMPRDARQLIINQIISILYGKVHRHGKRQKAIKSPERKQKPLLHPFTQLKAFHSKGVSALAYPRYLNIIQILNHFLPEAPGWQGKLQWIETMAVDYILREILLLLVRWNRKMASECPIVNLRD